MSGYKRLCASHRRPVYQQMMQVSAAIVSCGDLVCKNVVSMGVEGSLEAFAGGLVWQATQAM